MGDSTDIIQQYRFQVLLADVVRCAFTGSAMMMLLLGSMNCVCGAHGADTALSVAGAGTVSTLAVPPQHHLDVSLFL